MNTARYAITFGLLVTVLACSRGHITIYARPELAGATVRLNDVVVSTMSTTTHNYRWTGLRGIFGETSLPPRRETFARFRAERGVYTIRIEKEGHEPIVHRLAHDGENAVIDLTGGPAGFKRWWLEAVSRAN